MAETLKSFMVSIGFAVDDASQAKVELKVKAHEASLTATTVTELKRRQAAQDKMDADRINAVVSVGAELDDHEKAAAARFLRTQQERSDKQAKVETEAAKKSREQREKLFKEVQASALKFAAVMTGVVAAAGAVATGIVASVDRASKGMENMHYAAQRIGGSVRNITAFAFGIGQLGGSVDAANASLETFGQHLKMNPAGFEGLLKSLGVETRDAAGHLRDSAELATDALQSLRSKPYAVAKNYADTLGFDDITLRAGMDPRLPEVEAQRRADQAKVGYDPDKAGDTGSAFERSLRRLQNILGDVGDKIEASLAAHITPWLNELSNWVAAHGAAVTDGLTKVGDKIIALAVTFTKYLGSDAFANDVKAFTNGVASLAHFIRRALETLGILPSSAAAATPNGITETGMGNLAVFQDAVHRGKGTPFGTGNGNQDRANETLEGFRQGRGVGKAQQGANANAWADEMRKAGMPDEGIAATLGSVQTESTFNPRAHNNIAGGHTGHIQWDSVRWSKVSAWIKSQGGDPWDTRWQARAFIAEGRAKPGEPLFDSSQTQRGFARLMQSRGNLDLAVAGIGDIERFGKGEEGGRAANARAWLPVLPKPTTVEAHPSEAARNAAIVAGGKRGVPAAMPSWVGSMFDPNSAITKAPPLTHVSPAALSSMVDNSRTRGDITHNPTFHINGGDTKQNLEAARLTAGRGMNDLLRNMQGMEA